MPRFCPQCGFQVSDNARFCPKCGTDVSQIPVQPAEPAAPAQTVVPPVAPVPPVQQPPVQTTQAAYSQPNPYQPQPNTYQPQQSTFLLPRHSNMMAWSVIVTLFCCLIGGIIAVVSSSKSNSCYQNAQSALDDNSRRGFYEESEKYNKRAKTWIWLSIGICVVFMILAFVLQATGVLDDISV